MNTIPDYYDADYVANVTYEDRYMDDETADGEEEEWL